MTRGRLPVPDLYQKSGSRVVGTGHVSSNVHIDYSLRLPPSLASSLSRFLGSRPRRKCPSDELGGSEPDE